MRRPDGEGKTITAFKGMQLTMHFKRMKKREERRMTVGNRRPCVNSAKILKTAHAPLRPKIWKTKCIHGGRVKK